MTEWSHYCTPDCHTWLPIWSPPGSLPGLFQWILCCSTLLWGISAHALQNNCDLLSLNNLMHQHWMTLFRSELHWPMTHHLDTFCHLFWVPTAHFHCLLTTYHALFFTWIPRMLIVYPNHPHLHQAHCTIFHLISFIIFYFMSTIHPSLNYECFSISMNNSWITFLTLYVLISQSIQLKIHSWCILHPPFLTVRKHWRKYIVEYHQNSREWDLKY